MDTDVQLMGVARRSGNSVYEVYAYFKEPWRQSEVGKVLITNLGASGQFTKTYSFTDSQTQVGDNTLTRELLTAGMVADHWIYGGEINALTKLTEIALAFTDWTDDGNVFGFLDFSTDSVHCRA